MIKKVMYFLSITTLLFLAACASSSSDSSENNGVDGENTGTENGEQITIKWWDPSTGINAEELDKIIAEYEDENPNVNIERNYIPFEDIQNQLMMGSAAQELPDITIIDNPIFQSFAASGILADITDRVSEWETAEHYFEGPWSSTVYDEKNYGIPSYSNNLALFYNVDLLKEAGFDEPPKTWDELREVAEATTTSNVRGLSFSAIQHEVGTFHFLPWLWQAGSDIMDLNSQGTIDALNFWKEMIDKGYTSEEVLSLDQNDIVYTFASGNEAMMVNGTWQIPVLEEEAEVNWDVTTLPEYKQGSTVLGGYNWAITEASKHKDIAWDIIMFAEEKDRKLRFLKNAGYIPSRSDLIDDPHWQEDEHLKVFADSMDVAKARAYGPNYPEISIEIQNMFHSVMLGEKTAKEAAAEAAKNVEPLLP